MREVGEKKYPENIYQILDDPGLRKALLKYAVKEVMEENVLFLVATKARFNTKSIYKTFLSGVQDDGSIPLGSAPPNKIRGWTKSINIPAPIVDQAKNLAFAEDWTSSEWVDVIRKARKDIANLLQRNLRNFWDSDQFWDHHVENGGRRDDRLISHNPDVTADEGRKADGSPATLWDARAAAKRLDLKHPDWLDKYMQAYRRHGAEKAAPVAQAYIKKEGKKWAPAALNKLLLAHDFMRETHSPDERTEDEKLQDLVGFNADDLNEMGVDAEELTTVPVVHVDLKKLQKLGFQQDHTKELRKKVMKMANAYLEDKHVKSKELYQELQAAEPRHSKLQKVSFVKMIELLKKKSVIGEGPTA